MEPHSTDQILRMTICGILCVHAAFVETFPRLCVLKVPIRGIAYVYSVNMMAFSINPFAEPGHLWNILR